jgi:tRNA threonylcarbamoyl adenosine modification protein (Sua5/YciO/YrdC/YwlC family)
MHLKMNKLKVIKNMTELLSIHPEDPQLRLIRHVVESIQQGGVAILPTDSGYAFCCGLGEKKAIERIRAIRQLDKNHYFTLFCRDFSEIAAYAKVDNLAFRFLKRHTPGAITFILFATKEVPQRLQHPKRKTIGIRIPENKIIISVLTELGAPLMHVSVQTADEWPPADAESLYERYHKQVNVIVDGGPPHLDHTTVVDLTNGLPEVIRQGSYRLDL